MKPSIIIIAVLSVWLFIHPPGAFMLLLFGAALAWPFLYRLGWIPRSVIKPFSTLLPKIIYYLVSL